MIFIKHSIQAYFKEELVDEFFSKTRTSLLCSLRRTVLASTSLRIRLKSSLSTLNRWQLSSRTMILAALKSSHWVNTTSRWVLIFRGEVCRRQVYWDSSDAERLEGFRNGGVFLLRLTQISRDQACSPLSPIHAGIRVYAH